MVPNRLRRIAPLLSFILGASLHAQSTPIGDMPRPSQQGSSLRFQNANATAVITPLSPEVIRVQVATKAETLRHTDYAVINRSFGDPGATVSIDSAQRFTAGLSCAK